MIDERPQTEIQTLEEVALLFQKKFQLGLQTLEGVEQCEARGFSVSPQEGGPL